MTGVPGHGVPRASIIVNHFRVEAVLDGGSTVSIVSLNLVHLLGIQELEATNRSQGMADGRRIYALGIVRGLKVIIGNKNVTITDACVFEDPGYDMLLDRVTLAKLRVSTDWDSNFWYIKTDIGTIPLNINYNDSKVRPPTRVEYADNLDADSTSDSDNDEDDSYDSAYLISFASDSEKEDLNEVQSEKAFLVHHTDNTNIEVIRSELKAQVEKGAIGSMTYVKANPKG